jgi:hypothetical protein
VDFFYSSTIPNEIFKSDHGNHEDQNESRRGKEKMTKKIGAFLALVCLLSACHNNKIAEKPLIQEKTPEINSNIQKETVYPAISEEVNNRSTIEIILTEWERMPYQYESIFWSETYHKGHSNFGIIGSYPKFKGFKNKSFQKEVNLAILESIKSFQGYEEKPSMHSVDTMREVYLFKSDSYLKDLCENDDTPYSGIFLNLSFSYMISLLTPEFISIIFLSYPIIGPTGAYETAYTMNIDIKNEKIIRQPLSLFSTSNYWNSLKPLFLEKMKTLNPAIKSATIDDERLSWDSIWQYISFAFTPTNFLIIYNENETYSMDKRYIVSIPYNAVIHLLNKDFINLNQWQDAYSHFTAMKDWSRFSFFDSNNQVFGYLVKYPNGCSISTDLDEGQIIIDIPSNQAKITIQYPGNNQSQDNNYSDLIEFRGYTYEMTEFPDESYTILSARERNIMIKIEYMPTLTDDSMLEINKILSTIRLY